MKDAYEFITKNPYSIFPRVDAPVYTIPMTDTANDATLIRNSNRLNAFDEFYTDVSCLFAEGVEFMDKIQLYNAFKEGFLKLQERLK